MFLSRGLRVICTESSTWLPSWNNNTPHDGFWFVLDQFFHFLRFMSEFNVNGWCLSEMMVLLPIFPFFWTSPIWLLLPIWPFYSTLKWNKMLFMYSKLMIFLQEIKQRKMRASMRERRELQQEKESLNHNIKSVQRKRVFVREREWRKKGLRMILGSWKRKERESRIDWRENEKLFKRVRVFWEHPFSRKTTIQKICSMIQ